MGIRAFLRVSLVRACPVPPHPVTTQVCWMGWKIKKNDLNQYLFLLMKLQNLEEFNNILVHPASGAWTLSKGRPPIARLYNYGHTIFCFEKTLHCDNFIPCQRARKIWNITLPETSKDMIYYLARDFERDEILPYQGLRKRWNITLPETSKSRIISGKQMGYTFSVILTSLSSSTSAISLSYLIWILYMGLMMIRLIVKCCSRPLLAE